MNAQEESTRRKSILRKQNSDPTLFHAIRKDSENTASTERDEDEDFIGNPSVTINCDLEEPYSNSEPLTKGRKMNSDNERSIIESSFEPNAKKYSVFSESNSAKESLISALSALYAMLLIIMSLGFEVSILVVDSVSGSNYDFFYIYLYSMALLFLVYCYAFLLNSDTNGFSWRRLITRINYRNSNMKSENNVENGRTFDQRRRSVLMSIKRKITHSAKGAGSLYLRLGCVVFGVVGMISKGLFVFSAFDMTSMSCIQSSSITETLLSGIFIFTQMFFVFENSKLVIHRFKSVAKIGLMHLIATNLCMWIRSLVEEQFSIMKEVNESMHEREAYNSSIALLHAGASSMHNAQTVANHPVVLESLLNHAGDAKIDSIDPTLCPQSISYVNQRHAIGILLSDVKPFMTTCIIEYSLICSAVMYILWRHVGHVPKLRIRQRKQRFHVDCSSSTRGLFVGLLFMVFTIISMLIFFTKVRSRRNYEALWIFYASDSFLYAVSIAALILATIRVRKLFYVPGQHEIVLLDDILLIVGLVGQLMFCVFSVVPLNSGSLTATLVLFTSILRMVEVLLQTIFIFFGQRLVTMHRNGTRDRKPGRELVTFLLLTNLSMFLINTFETQKASSNPLMSEFYGKGIWTVIVHSTTPLTIFYRFHSTVCLAEIWKSAYRVKDTGSTLSLG